MAVVVVVGGAAGFGVLVVVVAGDLRVDDNPFRSAAWARIVLSTGLINMVYWSSSSGVSRVTPESLTSALNPSYNEVRLAASFPATSEAYLWKSAR